MEEILDPSYGHSHRAFLQALMARGAMTYQEARPVLAAIWSAGEQDGTEHQPDEVTERDFAEYIDIARQAASLFDYDIRSAVHQSTKQRIYALVNTTSDPQTQLATTYSPDELSFIKRLFDAMFETFNSPRMEVMAVTQMQAMKLARPNRRQSQIDVDEGTQTAIDRGLKHSEVEDVLAKLVNGGWLERSREQFYSLTPRGLLELRPWLMETYNDPDAGADEWQRIKLCAACKDLITYGLRCADPACNFRLHDVCEDAFWRVRGDKRCPKCSREWNADHYVGERAVTQTEAFQRGRRRTTGGVKRRTTLADEVLQQHAEQEGDEEGDVEEED
ncbi:hypothetical protein ACO1O0_006277 [Amphichorda felina]